MAMRTMRTISAANDRGNHALDDAARSFFLMARETMLGLALGRATNGAPLRHEEQVLEHLLGLAHEHDARLGRQESSP